MSRVGPWGGSAGGWDDFVRASRDGHVMHLHAWRTVVESAYGLRTFYLAVSNGGIEGLLPLVLIRRPLSAGTLVSMPFADYGGACVDGKADVERELVDEARHLAARLGAALHLRYTRPADIELPCSLEKASVLMSLGGSEDVLWKRLPSERRNRIRKAQRSGLQASIAGAEALADFYTVFAENMRDLGSPVHSLRFFHTLLQQLPEHARLVVVRHEGRPVGAGLFLAYEGVISMPWVSSLRAFFHQCPNQLLYWELMRHGIATGQRVLDFGRSSVGSGGFEAKRQWGGEVAQHFWHFDPAGAPPGHEGRTLAWISRLWRNVPLPVANALGPYLRRSLPN